MVQLCNSLPCMPGPGSARFSPDIPLTSVYSHQGECEPVFTPDISSMEMEKKESGTVPIKQREGEAGPGTHHPRLLPFFPATVQD